MRPALGALALALVLACESESTPIVWDQPGEPCNSPAWCVSEALLRECQERRWIDVDCEARCAAQGLLSAGCQAELQGARCLCEACPGPLACVDADTIEVCVDGQKVAQPCAERCSAAGYDGAHGCRTTLGQPAACQCSDSTSCTTPGDARCLDAAQLATCQAGAWTLVDCPASCDNPAAVCTFDALAQSHVCDCSRSG